MLRRIFLGFMLISFVSCQDETTELPSTLIGDWEISIFQFLLIEGTEVVTDETFLEAGQLSLEPSGIGHITFKSIEPWGFSSSEVQWSHQDEKLILLISGSVERVFELNIPNQDQLALTERFTQIETEQMHHQFEMTTIQLNRVQ